MEIIDNGAATLVHDIARFDGHDVRAENLLTRLAPIEAVRDELQSVDCWPAFWLTERPSRRSQRPGGIISKDAEANAVA